MKSVAFHNLGCKVNSYETEAMQQRLKEEGYKVVSFHEMADIYIINTCTVTNIADRKSRQMLHRAKKKNKDAIVIAVGCYAQVAKEACLSDNAVDIVIGNNKKGDIIQILKEYEAGKKGDYQIDINHTKEYEDTPITKVENHTRAYMKVQDGCDQFCSYCIIPFARGRIRSREMVSILQEAKKLEEGGYKEIILTGIHLSSYGVDFPKEKKETLLSLIKYLHEIAGIERIRLGSLEPRIVTEEFAYQISRLPKVCPHFHLSLQSGCDRVLERMNRKYTISEYKKACEELRRYYENPALTTDVIVGFPQETQEEFEITKRFLEEIQFFEMHVFPYSKREGTKAAKMEGQVPEEVKAKRSEILLSLEQEMSFKFRTKFLNKVCEVLVEEIIEWEGKKYQAGHTKEYIKVLFFSQEDLRGTIVQVVLKELREDFMIGKLGKV